MEQRETKQIGACDVVGGGGGVVSMNLHCCSWVHEVEDGQENDDEVGYGDDDDDNDTRQNSDEVEYVFIFFSN
jgi:hypothetical protein